MTSEKYLDSVFYLDPFVFLPDDYKDFIPAELLQQSHYWLRYFGCWWDCSGECKIFLWHLR